MNNKAKQRKIKALIEGGISHCEVRRPNFEHWVVTEWFANNLQTHGERVIRDSGLTLWVRTTTDQELEMDDVMGAIIDQSERELAALFEMEG